MALPVITADKLANVRAITTDFLRSGEEIWERFNGKCEGTLWYHRAMADALLRHGHALLIDTLDRAVRELDRAAGK